jgi:membrane fusion protein (multidrug efflux system)
MASKFIYPVVAAVGIAAASGAAWWYQNKAKAPASEVKEAAGSQPAGASTAARPVMVEAAKVEVVRLTDDMQTVGNLRSRQGVMLRPEVSGRVTQLNFRDGDRVRKGQLLVQFDDQLPLAQVKQSQAELSIALANHKRNQELAGQSFISARSVDESAANLEVAQAKLALSQATAARLKIMAPFDGIAGIRAVNVGDYLKDGSDVVNIEDIDVIFVDFRLPERFQTKVKRGQRAIIDLDALPGRKFSAVIQAIDPLIDANGRSVGLRGCIDNRQLQLRPGMFARVNLVFGERENALVVPEEAIVPQGGRQFVIKLAQGPDSGTRVTQRVEVKVGLRAPGKVEIVDGLREGDSVITAGQQRVQKDGSVVRVIDLAKPAGERAAGPASGAASAATATPAASNAGSTPAAVKPVLPSTLLATPGAAAKSAVGPNPCLVGMSDSPAADKATTRRRNASPENSQRPAGRNPA